MIIGIVLGGLFIWSLLLPWLHAPQIKLLMQQVKQLQAELETIRVHQADTRPQPIPKTDKTASLAAFVHDQPEPAPVRTAPLPPPVPIVPPAPPVPIPPAPKAETSFEQQIGARLPVWIGGIALAFAGIFMVKYSIEAGLLSPSVRLVIGGLFGLGLLAGGHLAREYRIADHVRIAQALTGAGIADLYACLFAAGSIYHLLPGFISFAGMAGVTAAAVVLSLRHGMPIALLGLVGGFLTPALVGSHEPNAVLLFGYLYGVVLGLFMLIRRQDWWWLSLPAVIGAFLWVLVWLASGFTPQDGVWISIFLMAVTATVVNHSARAMEATRMDKPVADMLNTITLGGGMVLMAAVSFRTGFSLMQWGLFGLLAAGGVALAYFHHTLYRFVPWLSLMVTLALLAGWHTSDSGTLTAVLCAFALLYTMSGYGLMWRSVRLDTACMMWGRLCGVAAIAFYLLAYIKLNLEPHLLSLLALGLSCLSVMVVRQILDRYQGSRETVQQLLAVFAVSATAFLSLAFSMELSRDFLPLAFAAELLAVSWIATRLDIDALRLIAALLGCCAAAFMLPHVMLLIQIMVYSLEDEMLFILPWYPPVNLPLLRLGLPAVCLAAASVFLRQRRDGHLVAACELAAIALIAALLYYLLRELFQGDALWLIVKTGWYEGSIVTNVFFLYALACFAVGHLLARPSVNYGGFLLSCLAITRVVYFPLLSENPLWQHVSVGSWFLFNALLPAYALPVLWLKGVNIGLAGMGKDHYRPYTDSLRLLLALVFVSFTVRQCYHGEYLDHFVNSKAEIYSYSIVWLVMGIGLLFYGTLRHHPHTRLAALAILTLTVGKVFLFDAAALTGLLRVFSFLGLGLSLMGISWFYTRFIAGK